MPSDGRIPMEDGAIVYDHLIWRDARGTWWAYRDLDFLFASDLIDLLTRVAEAFGVPADPDDLRSRYDRAVALAARWRREDERRAAVNG